MINLLAQKDKKAVKKEYLLKLLSLKFTLLGILCLFFILTIAPTLIGVYFQNRDLESHLDFLNANTPAEQESNQEAFLELSSLVNKFNLKKISLETIIKQIEIESDQLNISINSYEYEDENLMIRGDAIKRKDVTDLAEVLEKTKEVISVDIPYSQFIEETDIRMQLNLKLK